MLLASVILAIISAFVLLESFFILFFPEKVKAITFKIFKKKKNLKVIGIIELLIGIGLLIFSLYI